MLALVVDVLARPGTPDEIERLLQARDLLLLAHPEQLELRVEVPEPAAQAHAAVGDDVHHRGGLRHLNRVVERQQEDRRPDLDPLGPRGERRTRDQRRGQITVGHHVMLRDEDAVEAALLGYFGRAQNLLPAAYDVPAVGWVLRHEQHAETHLTPFSSVVPFRGASSASRRS